MDEAPLTIDLDDEDDIRRKLPEVEERVTTKRKALAEDQARLDALGKQVADARADFERWDRLFGNLRAMVPSYGESKPVTESPATDTDDAERSAAPRRGDDTSVAIVVRAVNEAGREMRTREVRAAVVDYGLADDTVSWALWKASSLGLLRQVKRGWYAPLESASGQSELSVSPNGKAAETVQAEETAGLQNR